MWERQKSSGSLHKEEDRTDMEEQFDVAAYTDGPPCAATPAIPRGHIRYINCLLTRRVSTPAFSIDSIGKYRVSTKEQIEHTVVVSPYSSQKS